MVSVSLSLRALTHVLAFSLYNNTV